MLKQRDFEFIKIISSGSFGKVFLARRIKDDKLIAIKKLDLQILKANRQIDCVYNEVKILKTCAACPFIVNFEAFIETGKDFFIGMEYVKGGELFYYIKKHGRMEFDTSVFFASEVLLALKFLHSNNIIYRDLKPENILITENGHAKLTDFGFATTIDQNTFLICGTPEYMAPEKLLGNGDTKETDFWAFGCLIYEMLVGNPPFYFKNTNEIYKAVLEDEVTFPAHVNSQSKDMLFKLLKKDREYRLGARGIMDIFRHPFFMGIDWDSVLNQKIESPINPDLNQFSALSYSEDINMDHISETRYRRRLCLKKIRR